MIFKKGQIPWNKGKKATEKQLEALRLGRYKGKYFSEKTKSKMSEAKLKNPVKYNLGKHLSETTRKRISDARLLQIFPQKDTSIEIKLQNELLNRGIIYEKHYPIFGQPDICFPDQKVAIFADGNYWHNRPEVKERDLKVNKVLRINGWFVLRFWEYEIDSNIKAVADEIEGIYLERR